MAGMGMTFAGSVVTMAGIFLAPSTFGISVTLTVSGVVIGAVGSIFNFWSLLKKDLETKSICKEAKNVLNQEKYWAKKVTKMFPNAHFRRQMEDGLGALLGKCAQESLNLANLFSSIIHTQNCSSASFLLNQNLSLHYMGLGISFFFTSLELVKIIEATIDLKKGLRNEFSEKIRTFANKLDRNVGNFEKYINQEFNFEHLSQIKEC
ncbi:hypothetical protein BpHYR1_029210 [Brachionus plicatilis]|uniref:Uncharacterized protein n=1 Tax=Brachionus plicatilis TaxID=10195 RepID=A0A3M7S4F4_BRAPC|nr:hypothetical protein BpHYR1_029210 [Brachionus plicatilis]